MADKMTTTIRTSQVFVPGFGATDELSGEGEFGAALVQLMEMIEFKFGEKRGEEVVGLAHGIWAARQGHRVNEIGWDEAIYEWASLKGGE